jgi:hypothetical protein
LFFTTSDTQNISRKVRIITFLIGQVESVKSVRNDAIDSLISEISFILFFSDSPEKRGNILNVKIRQVYVLEERNKGNAKRISQF